jgi:hypothetical protein
MSNFDISIKLSGMKALAFEYIKGGWSVLCEFAEKRPIKANPVFTGFFAKVAEIALSQSKGRLTNAREVVFFPLLSDTQGYMDGMVLDRGSYTVKGFSRFFRQADYDIMFNSPRQARLDGSFEYRNKRSDANNTNQFMVIQKENAFKTSKKVEISNKHSSLTFAKGTKDDNFKLIEDTENLPEAPKVDLESIYPLRYVLSNGVWVPQVVFNFERFHKSMGGVPSPTKERPKGTEVFSHSAANASIAGTWNPVNALNRHPDKKFYNGVLKNNSASKGTDNKMDFKPGRVTRVQGSFYMPKHLKPLDETQDAQLETIDKTKQAYEASRVPKVKTSSAPFNPPRIIQK